MAAEDWDFGRYRCILKVQARMLQLDPRLGRRLDSSDLVQETLLRAHERRGQFRGSSEGERVRWLQRIFTRVAHDRLEEESAQRRDYRREAPIEDLLDESSARLEALLASPAAPPDEQLQRQESVIRLFQAINTLPEDQRDAIILRYLRELPLPEIARLMQRSERAVAGLLFRAMGALREFGSYLAGDEGMEAE